MYKFYWSNLQKNQTGANGTGSTPTKDESKSSSSEVPERPISETSATSSSNESNAPPTGSQKVLLKLRKMSSSSSGSSRPKSVPADLKDPSDLVNSSDSTSTDHRKYSDFFQKFNNHQSSSSKLPNSQSHNTFLYKTWNENTLNKEHHNYENVYCSNRESIYENAAEDDHLVISEMRHSPRTRSRRQFLFDMTSLTDGYDDEDEPPIPPIRKGRKKNVGENKSLYRSKSCERPKKKDTFRIQNNLNRLSSNITDRFRNQRTHNDDTISRNSLQVRNGNFSFLFRDSLPFWWWSYKVWSTTCMIWWSNMHVFYVQRIKCAISILIMDLMAS